MSIRILYVAEIVGKAGVFTLKKTLPRARRELRADFVIGNADSATGGAGLGRQHAAYLRKIGLDVITLGECSYYKRDLVENMDKMPWLIRPANYPYGNPGRGWRVYQAGACKVGVIQLLGQAGFSRVHPANPLQSISELARKLREETPIIVLDFHAAATAEKSTMAFFADGKVSAVIGSHGKTLTADARLLPGGSACITDAGRTGSLISVGGFDPETKIREFMSGIPSWPKDGSLGLELQGCVVEIGDDGRALSIESVRLPCKEALDDGKGKDTNTDPGSGDDSA